jgi:hypothetical protein
MIMIHNNKKRTLFVAVDDEPDITFVFKVCLEINGFAVDAFNDPLW